MTDKNLLFYFLLIVVLFDFLNIKSVKIYVIPYICSPPTLLLYKLDILLLKQMNVPVLDMTGFFFRIRTQVTHLGLYPSTHAEKETRYFRFFCFNNTVSYTCKHHLSRELAIFLNNLSTLFMLFLRGKPNLIFRVIYHYRSYQGLHNVATLEVVNELLRSAFLLGETGVSGENHRLDASH